MQVTREQKIIDKMIILLIIGVLVGRSAADWSQLHATPLDPDMISDNKLQTFDLEFHLLFYLIIRNVKIKDEGTIVGFCLF